MKLILKPLLFMVLLLAQIAWAGGPKGVTFSGQIVSSTNGKALTAANVDFYVKILSPNGCVLYTESHLGKNLSTSEGTFDLVLGSGTSPSNVYDSSSPQSASALRKLFDNNVGAIGSLSGAESSDCAGTNYTPGANDVRRVRVEFDAHNGDGLQVVTPYHTVRNVPYSYFAQQAEDSNMLGGKPASNYLETSQLAAAESDPTVKNYAKTDLPTCGPNEVLKSDGTSFSCISDQVGGGTPIATTTSTGVVQIGAGLSVDVAGLLSVDYTTVKSNLSYSIGDLKTSLGAPQFPDAACSADKTLTWSAVTDTFNCTNISITSAAVSDFSTAVDARIAADSTLVRNPVTSSVDVNDKNLTNTGYITMNPNKSLHLSNTNSDPAGLTALDKGKMWFRADLNELRYWNGTAAVTVGAAGAGLQSINGQTNNAQSIVVDANGTDIALNSSSGTHTLSIPSASATNRGALTSSDWTLFNSKLGAVTNNADLANNKIWVGDATGKAQEVSVSGDASLDNTGALTLSNSGVTAGTYSKVTVDSKGRVTVGANIAALDITTALGFSPLNKAGDVMTGPLGLNSVTADPAGLTGADTGKVWYRSDLNEIRYWNGSAAVALGAAGAGMQSLNGLTDNAQTLGIGTSGLAPSWNSVTGTHTLNIPMASGAGVTAGLISKADYDTFNAKQPAGNYITDLTGDVTATGPGSAAATIANSAVTSAKIADGTIVGSDLDFTGVINATTGLVLQDSTGKFNNYTCGTNGNVLTWTASGWSCQPPTPLLPSLADGKIWIGDGTNAAVAQTMSGDATISNTGALTLANSGVTAGTYSKVTVDAKGRVTVGADIASSDVTTALGFTPLNKAGDSMSGALGLNSVTSDPAGLTAADKGKVWYRSDLNEIRYWNGTAAVALGAAGAGMQSFNGLTDSAQSFVINSAGSDVAINSASGTHTLSIPSASATNRGVLTSADWTTFNSKVGSVGATAPLASSGGASPVISINSGTLAGQTLRWDGTNWVAAQLSNSDVTGLGALATKNSVDLGTADATGTLDAARMPGLTGDITSTAGSTATTLSNTGVTAGTYSKVTVDAKGRVTVGADIASSDVTTALGFTPLNKAGDTMSGALGLNSVTSDPAGLTAADKGKVWYRSDLNEIRYWNGTAAVALGAAGAGMQSLNGLTDNTQTLGIGTSGLAPAWNSVTGTHTLNIPMASGAGVTAGLISKADYDTFNAKQPAGSYITALTGDVTAAGPGSAAATIANNAITSGKIADGTIIGTDMDFTGVINATTGLVLQDSTGKFNNYTCGTNGNVLTWTASGWSCQPPTPLLPSLADGKIWIGDGTNAAVAQSMSGDATISNTGALTLANSGVTAGTYPKVTVDAKGRVTAGTTLSATDIPALDWSKITTGLPTTLSGYGITDGVKNIAGTPSIETGTLAARPAFGTSGRLYIASDNNTLYRDTGTAWVAIGDGTGAGGTVTSVTSANTDLSVSNTTTTPVITLNSGTTGGAGDANKIAKLDAGGLLAPAMIPSLDAAKIGTGTLPIARGGTNSSTALNNNRVMVSNGGAIVEGAAITANRALISDANGIPTQSAVTNTELGYLSGVTSSVQTQLNGMAQLAGRTGGQNLQGGTAASENLTLDSTSNATKGYVLLNPTGGNVGIGTSTPSVRLDVAGAVRVGTDATACAVGVAGAIRYNGGSVEFCNGTAWTAFAASGSGITSLNGLTGNTQTFATPGTTGTAPNWSSAGSAHTLNIPMANTATVTAGLISKTEYDTFNSKLGTATTFSGDVSGTYNATSVDKIKGKAVSATAPTSGQFLVYDGTTQYSPVAMSGDATMTNTGAVTLKNTGTAGTYTKVTTDAQGRVTSGTTLSAADIPALDWSKITTGLPTTLSGYGITDGVKNIAGTPSIETGTLAARPAFGTAGRLYIASDNNTLYRDTGAAWVAIGDGTGAGGTVTSVTSTNGDISVANTTTTPALTLNAGTTGGAGDANKIAKLDASGLLAPAMIPSLDAAKIGTGTLPIARGGTNSSTALSNNRVMVSSGGAIVEGAAITANRALISDANGIPTQSAVTNTELGYVSGVTSAIQTQLNGMAQLAGRSGGQNLRGGTAASENLTLDSTSNATKGYVLLNPTGGNVGIGTSTPAIKLDVAGAVRVGTDATACAVGVAGAIRYNSGNVEYCNGTAWTAFAASGAGITSLNGLTGNTQTFATPGTTGTAPNWSSAGSAHTLNIPMANTATVTAGLISKAEYDTFNSKLGTATAFSGDVSGTYNATSVDKIKGKAVSATAPTSGQFLVYDGTTQYSPVAMSGDATMSNTGAVTLKNTGTAGTYTKVTTDAQGRVTSGTTLSATDIPALDWSKITTGLPTTLSGYGITDAVKNNGGTPSIQTGTLASRPAFGTAGRIYIASDNNTIYRDTGAAWVTIGDGTGSGGTVTSVTSANSDISVATTTTTPVLTLNSGTTGGAGDANKIAKLDAGGLLPTAMIPSLDAAKITTGTLPIARGGTNSATALNNNRVMVSSGGAIIEGAAITANRALISDANGIPTQSAVTNTELGYVSGVTSAIQTQLNGMAQLAGRAGGQNLRGGTAASENLTLESTSNATKGYVLLNPTAGNVGIGTSTPAIKLDVAGAVRVGTDATACAVGVAGAIRYNSGNVEYCNGTAWTAFAASGAGITSLNGLTGNTQTFATPGTTGTAPNWSSAGSAHTLNIPMANTATVTAGLISKAEYDTFNNKLGTATAFSGDVSGTYNATSVDKIKGTAVTITSLTNKDYLKYNGTAWVNSAINAATDLTGILPVANGGTGASSLGSGNLLVGAGTGAVTSLAAGSAGNVVYASGIATWASGTPDTAGLVDKTSTQVISGAKAFTNYVQMSQQNAVRFADSDSTNYVAIRSPATVAADVTLTLPATAGSNGQVLTTDGAGVLSWSTPSAGGGALSSITAATAINTIDNLNFAQTWNWSTASTQSPMTITANALTTGSLLNLTTSNGTLNSTNGLLNVANTGASTSGKIARIQSNSTAGSGLTVLANGNVGIGTDTPTQTLHVVGYPMFQANDGGYLTLKDNGNASSTTNFMSAISAKGSDNGIVWELGDLSTSSKTVGLSATAGHGLSFSTASTERIAINSSGNIGIGASSPVDPFSFGIAPTASATKALVNLSNTALSGASANGTYIGANPAAFTGDFINLQVAGATKFKVSNTGVITGDGSGLTNISGAIAGMTAGRVALSTGATTIGDSANLTFASATGALGLGGTAPAVTSTGALTVQGASGSATTVGNSGTTSSLTLQSGSGGISLAGNTSISGANTFTQTYTGTTTDASTFTANSLTTGSILNLSTSNAAVNSTNGLLYVANTGASTSGAVARIQSNSTAGSGLTVLANGNVGIGTASPSTGSGETGLHISGGKGAIKIQSTTTPNNFYLGSVGSAIISSSNLPMDFWVGAQNPMTMATSGFVGIGTASPSTKLHVAGGDIMVNSDQSVYFGTSWNTAISGKSDAVGTSDYLDMRTTNGRIRIDANGRVGIGTSAPVDTLSIGVAPVAGATRAQVNLSNTALSGASANGTYIGANPAAFTGDFINLQVAGATKFKVSNTGVITGDGSGLTNISGAISGMTAGRVALSTGATSIGDSANLTFNSTTGVTTLGGSGPGLVSTGALTVQGAAGSATTIGNSGTTSSLVLQSGSGGISLAGNTSISGANTFSTGTGAVTLNGATTVSGTNTFATGTGNVSLNGATTVAANQNLSMASGTGTFTQTYTGTTTDARSVVANSLTTGSILNLSTSNATVNSTNGLLYVANTGASTSGITARIQSNSTAGSGLTVLGSGNVGIGSAAPVDTLSIGTAPVASATRAQVNFSNTALSGGSANGTYLGMNPAAFTGDLINFQVGGSTKFKVSNTGVITGDGSGLTNISGAISGMTAGRVALSTGATTIGDSANLTFTTATGALGLAGTAPALTSSGALTVQGASGSATTVGNSGTTSSLTLQSGSGGISLAGNTSISGANTFSTGTGNVSLNGATTVAANQNLSMASGTGTFTQTYTGSGTNAAYITANSLTGGNILSLNSVSTTATSGHTGLNITSSGANSTASVTRYGIQSVVSATGTTNTNIAGYFAATGGTTNYGLLVNGGNVGIGTVTPGAPLDVKGAIRMSGITSGYTGFQPASAAGSTVWTLPSADGTNGQVLTTNGTGILSWSTPAGGSALSAITAATATNTIDNLLNAQTWNWSTATTQTPMTMTANGITTGSILSLTSSSAVNTGTNGLLYVANTTATTTGTVARIQSNSTAGSGLTVLGNGNVGIATSSPSYKLDVTGDIRLSGNLYTDTSNATYFNSSGGVAKWWVNGFERLRIDTGGNIGIGSIAPVDTLSIGVAPVASATRAQVNLSNTALSGASANGTYIGANPAAFTGDFINLQVGGASKFKVSNTGVITGDGSGLTNISGAISGMTAGRVALSTGATSIGDSANLTFNSTTGVTTLGGSGPGLVSSGALTVQGAAGSATTVGNSGTTSSLTLQSGSGGISLAGNTSISGANTFSTGTGAVTLNGATTVSGTNTFATGTGNVSLNGATTVAANQNLSMASGTGTFTQTFTGTTTTAKSITANSLTTGSILSATTSNGTVNSTNGLLYIANTGASTTGKIATIQSNSTAGSGLTVMANGTVGVGTASPSTTLDINGAETMRGMAAPAVSAAGQGRIYFDSTANKYKVSQNGGAYADLVSAGGGGALSAITAATATNTIDNLLNAQTWNWSTATTQTPMTLTANAITTGSILGITSASTVNTGSNGLLYVANTSAATTGTVARIQSSSAAGSGVTVLASGNVGVGTTSPTNILHVLSSAATNAKFESATGNNTVQFELKNGFSTGSPEMIGSTTDSLIFHTQGSERLRIDASGNVGIGSAAPVDTLSIGTAPVASATRAQVNLSNTALSGGSANGTYIGANPAAFTGDFINLQVGNATKFKVDATGKITGDGSGLTGLPAGALSAITAATATNTIDNLLNAQTWNWSTATTQTPMSMNANALTTGSMLSLATSNATVNSTNGLLYVANTGASTSGVTARIQSNSTAGSGLTVLANGRVGIGKVSPTNLLDIQTAASYDGLKLSPAAGSGYLMATNAATTYMAPMIWTQSGNTASAGLEIQAEAAAGQDSGTTPIIRLTADVGNNVLSTRPLMSVENNYNVKFSVAASGNVGIGATAPVDTLSISTAPVASATRAQVNLSNTALSGGSANGTYVGANPAAFTGDFINLQVAGATKFKVSNTGVITGDGSGITGITATDSTKLPLAGGTMTGAILGAAGTATAPGYSFSGDANNGVFSPGADIFAVSTAGAERLRVDASGNVAIGSATAPANKFSITPAANVTPGTYASYHLAVNTPSGAGAFIVGSDASYTYLESWNSRPLVVNSNSMLDIILSPAAGKVGIGTYSPAANTKLQVNGVMASTLTNDTTPTTIDLSASNFHYTTTACSGATWTLSNMVEGTTYTIAVQNNTHTGSCVFALAGSTFKYQPANATPASGHVVYSLMKVGTVVYVSWIDGFN